MPLDLDGYASRAEAFLEDLEREYYLHLSGQKPRLEIEPIYERDAELFEAGAVAALREAVVGDDVAERRRRYLLAFAFDGLLGRATRREAEAIAKLEVEIELAVDGTSVPYRGAHVELANEPAAGRRREIEEVRNAALAERILPLEREAFERVCELTRELGWASYAAAQEELRGIDLAALARQTQAFLAATAAVHTGTLGELLRAASLPPLGEAGRADVPRLLRGADLDELFPQARLLASFERTLGALGYDLRAQENVHLDAESRPTKSPRAFCSALRVPQEVYLVFAPIGGREDYRALFHEGGHTEHFANTDAALPFEFRHLGDNSVTESFAFLLEHLTDSPEWLDSVLGVGDAARAVAEARGSKLLFVRRYAAKLSYELELHSEAADLDAMPARYAGLLGEATGLGWPPEPWLDDVDGGFYVACYLRAWALEAYWRRALCERFGERWFAAPAAGEWLGRLWAQGQRLDAEELLAEELGEELDLGILVGEFVPGG